MREKEGMKGRKGVEREETDNGRGKKGKNTLGDSQSRQGVGCIQSGVYKNGKRNICMDRR